MAHSFSINATAYFSNPLTFTPQTLTTAYQGVSYVASVAPYASGGFTPYNFILTASVGPDSFTVSSSGIVNGTPLVQSARVTKSGAFRIVRLAGGVGLRVVNP